MSSEPSCSSVAELVTCAFDQQLDGLVGSSEFASIESGHANPDLFRAFLQNVYRTHLKSPQIVAMLYATSAPAVSSNMLRNLCEELGLAGDAPSHPALLHTMLEDIGVTASRMRELEEDAERDLRHLLSQPLMFPTLRETAFGMLLEVSSFEWALARIAGRLATAVHEQAGLSWATLRWFTLHATVDVRHADEAINAIDAFVEFYDMDVADVQTVIELTFRQNVLLRRYFPIEGQWGISGAKDR